MRSQDDSRKTQDDSRITQDDPKMTHDESRMTQHDAGCNCMAWWNEIMMQYFIVTLRNFITLQIQTCSNFKLVYLLHHVQNFIIEQTYSDFFINCTHMRKFQEILSNLVTYPLYLQCVPKKNCEMVFWP